MHATHDPLSLATGWLKLPPLPVVHSSGVAAGSWPCTIPPSLLGGDYVYLLIDPCERACYVGVTNNLRRRLATHAKTKAFGGWMARTVLDRLSEEQRTADVAMPYLNVHGQIISDPQQSKRLSLREIYASDDPGKLMVTP